MDAAPADSVARLFRRFGWPRAHLVVFALLCVGFAATPVVHALTHPTPNKDYRLWYTVGQQVRAGEPLYPDDPDAVFPYMYPPTLAVFVFAPLSLLGPAGFVAALTAGAAACWLLALLFAAKLVTGRFDAHPLVYVIPAVAAGPY